MSLNEKNEYLLPVNVLDLINQYKAANPGSPLESNIESRLTAIANAINTTLGTKKNGLRTGR